MATPWIVGGVAAAVFAVWISPFVLGGGKSDSEYSDWVLSISGGRRFALSLFRWGYFKYAARNLTARISRALRGVPVTKLGGPVPDAAVVRLDGRPCRLHEAITEVSGGNPSLPVVLNFGSYT
jgi:hypothetical protein